MTSNAETSQPFSLAVLLRLTVTTDILQIDGTRLAYHAALPDEPRTPPVVALHGFGTTGRRTFRYLSASLTKAGVPLYALDLLGFGGSDKPDDGYSLERYAALTTAFCAHLGLDAPVLLGHSMGGKIAVATAALHEDAFAGLGLINSAGFSRYARWLPYVAEADWTLALLEQPWVRRHVLPRTPLGPVLGEPEQHAAFLRLRDAHFDLDLDHAGLREPVRRLTLPTLVVWGLADPILPPSTLRRLRRDLPHAEIVTFADAGHAPMKEHPRAVGEAVARFVASLPSAVPENDQR